MKGDFTRFTFKKKNHYRDVRMQQGRVQLDADWNEQLDITAHRVEAETVDVVGYCGAPMHHGGFHVVTQVSGLTTEEQNRAENQNPAALEANGDVYISGGHYYVDGILCENEVIIAFTKQPDLPKAKPIGKKGTYLAYLDVWFRHLTALEAQHVREVALGGPDTTTRTKTIWQVKLLRVGDMGLKANCLSALTIWDDEIAPGSGKMAAQAEKSVQSADPCILAPDAGYQRLENQLYRVEVHSGGPRGIATFKWSRDNGSIVARWEKQDVNKLTVSRTGRDQILSFASGQWIELTDDTRDLLSKPGVLVQLEKVEGQILTIDPTTIIDPDNPAATSVDKAKFPSNPKIRRWDSDGLIKPTNLKWIDLEDGVQVQFSPGDYKTSDYWLIPARTATRTDQAGVEWPLDDNTKNPKLQLPHGINHHYCRLGLLEFDGNKWINVHDCRNIFPPVTELTSLLYVSGDGQEAMPGNKLDWPLQVRVVNGQHPVEGVKIQFTIEEGGGTLSVSAPVDSSPDGIAECEWTLGINGKQQVKAVLLDAAGQPVAGQIMHFNANLSIASQVAYDPSKCANLSGVTNVQDAIDILCQIQPGGGCCVTVGQDGEYKHLDKALKALLEKGQQDICICLLPGEHPFSGLELDFPVKEFEYHLRIVGCGLGSHVFLEQPMRFTGLKAFTLRDVAIELRFLAEGPKGAIALDRCSEVTLTACHVAGFTAGDGDEAKGALLSITNADRIHLRDNVIEAALINSFEPTNKIFEQTEVDFLFELFRLPEQGVFEFEKFRLTALESARKLADLDAGERKRIHDALRAASDKDELRTVLSSGELFSITKFNAALIAEPAQPEDLFNDLIDIRRAAIKSRSGVAVVLDSELRVEIPQDPEKPVVLDGDDYATLESNELIGILSLYGMPAPATFIDAIFKDDFPEKLEGWLKDPQNTLTGMLGTLQVRGNQLVQIAVARDIVEQLQKIVTGGQGTLFNLFGRCLMSDNVIEGATSVLVTQHLAMTANEFTLSALEIDGDTGIQSTVAIVAADSSIYVGNHGGKGNVVLRNASRANSQAANLEISIT